MAQNGDIKIREVDTILRRNGFVHNRTRGSHFHYVKDDKTVVVNVRTNRMVWKRICKENKLNID